jgi:hypothetical protein
VKKTTFVIRLREAVGDGARYVLNIDGEAPGRIYACIDEETQEEIGEQLAKRADTSNVSAPEREGYAVDAVIFSATLRDIFTAEVLPFDHDAEIDAWVAELEYLTQQLREYQARWQREASSSFCKRCLHSFLDHDQPNSGKLGCNNQNCCCPQFYPIDSKSLN